MEELKQQILDLCNSSDLPLECVVFVLKDAWRDAEAALRAAKARFPQETSKVEEGEKK